MTHLADAPAVLEWEQKGIVKAQQKLANFVQHFQNMMQVNAEGEYLYLIDPTVVAECVPYAETPDDVPEDKLKEAMIPIEFEDGMPCINGIPIWERLDGEPIPYYKIFQDYRDMKYYNDTNLNLRSIARLSEKLNIPGRLLNILAKIYHWAIRVKAYDKHREFEIALKKRRIVEELENKHAKYANEILEQAIEYLKKHPQQLTPKVAVQMIELGMKYGRISVGLLGDKPGSQVAALHQTNIAISQATQHNNAEQMVNVHAVGGDIQGHGSKSAVEQQLQNNLKDTHNLISILHVLNRSGAFQVAVNETFNQDNKNAPEVIESDDYTVEEV